LGRGCHFSGYLALCLPHDAALAELEQEPVVPEGETPLQLLQAIYRDKNMNSQDFASVLERAIQRSKSPLPFPAPTIERSSGRPTPVIVDIKGQL
jgi:hypothetical protein